MFRVVVVVIVALVAICLGSSPLYETRHYKVFNLENESTKLRSIKEGREYQEEYNGNLRTIIERPVDANVPEDSGSASFGDIFFNGLRRDGELIVRDTIVNQINDQNVFIYYNRSVPGYYVEDMRIYNVGRQRGWVYEATIWHNIGYVETQMLVAASNTVRIFVEIYVRVEDENTKKLPII